MSDLRCPHCGAEQTEDYLNECWEDADTGMSGIFTVECCECDREFKVCADVSVDFLILKD